MHDMPNLRPLEVQIQPRSGPTRLCSVRPGQILDRVSAPAHMPEAQACIRGCGGCPREVAGEVIEVSREWWEIGRRVPDDEVAA